MKVLKFGGSSVADAEAIGRVVRITGRARSSGQIVVVVSAFKGVTDELIAMADVAVVGEEWRTAFKRLEDRHLGTAVDVAPGDSAVIESISSRLNQLSRLLVGVEMLGDCPPASRDSILATGERLSAPIVAGALRHQNTPAEPVDGSEVLATDARFGGAAVLGAETGDRARSVLAPRLGDLVPVVTGFIGSEPSGRTTTIGRGGSDLTATVLGAALDAECVEIWTDVCGVLTAPPQLVDGARTQPRLSYDEAAELSRFGATVLYEKTIGPARDAKIPIVVRNTFDPDAARTTVTSEVDGRGCVRTLAVVNRASRFVVDLPPADRRKAAAALTDVASECLMVFQASASGRWTVVAPADRAAAITSDLGSGGCVVTERTDDMGIIAVVGPYLLAQPWLVGRCLETLGRHRIGVHGTVSGPSPHVACLVIDADRIQETLTVLHEALMLDRTVERLGGASKKSTTPARADRRVARARSSAA